MKKAKIHILGGGVSGSSAAYWLTQIPGWKDKYEIHLYQSGWRLGGKGASGRREGDMRSIEHGPHAWYGGYENGFRLMRGVFNQYAEKFGAHGRFSKLFGSDGDALFKPATEGEYFFEARQQVWKWVFPPECDPTTKVVTEGDGTETLGLVGCLNRIWSLIKENIEEQGLRSHFFDFFTKGQESEEDLIARGDSEIRGLAGKLAAGMGDIVTLLTLVQKKLLGAVSCSDCEYRVIVMLDLMTTLMRGSITDILVGGKDYDDLNEIDFQEWLEKHGAAYPCGDTSPYVLGLYDAAFAYKNGSERNIAAGTAIRIALWIFFGYKTHYLFKMQAGMGEVVFSPLYRVLGEAEDGEEPDVNFHFFHKVTGVQTDGAGNKVVGFSYKRQADCKVGEYEPLIDAKLAGETTPFMCWPEEPHWDQLVDGERLRQLDVEGVDSESRWTRVGAEVKEEFIELEDGDQVIFAMPAPVLPELVTELSEKSSTFAEMMEAIPSVATSAAQFWIEKQRADERLGDPHGLREEMILGGTKNPLSIHLDYSPVTLTEDDGSQGQHLMYSCGVIPEGAEANGEDRDGSHHVEQLSTFEDEVRKWLEEESCKIFPDLWPNGIDWSLLGGRDALKQNHYLRVNSSGASRYLLSPKGSIKYRLKPGKSGFKNLVLAGDWTKNGVDIGCVESAVISSMIAVEAVTGHELNIDYPLGITPCANGDEASSPLP